MIEALLLKPAIVISVALIAAQGMRRASAAMRHLLYLCAFLSLLLMPLWTFLPSSPMTLPPIVFHQEVAAATGASDKLPIGEWLFGVWLCGVVLFAGRLVFDLVQLKRILQAATPLQGNHTYPAAWTDALPCPAAHGLGNRRILLPEEARLWDADRLNIVLSHEISHLRRNDCWALLVSELVCALYWCNPFVWFAAARLRLEQEQAVDDEVVGAGAIDATSYATHLLAIAQGRAPRLAAGAFGRSDLPIRIRAILDPRRNRTMISRKMIVLSMAGLLCITIPLASMQAGKKIYSINDAGVTKPRLIEKNEPGYTEQAREAKIQGAVKLTVVIDVDGKAHDIKVIEGLDEGLDANAVKAVETWRFEPAQKAGESVPVSARIEVNFRLL